LNWVPRVSLLGSRVSLNCGRVAFVLREFCYIVGEVSIRVPVARFS
jgi:hypothetical protein